MMADLAAEAVQFLLPAQEICHFNEVSSLFEKSVDIANTYLHTRADIFLGKEESLKNYEHEQMEKLKRKEIEYVKKCQGTKKSIEDCKTELKKIEYEYFDKKNKLSSVQTKNKQLQDSIAILNSEKNNKVGKFRETCKHYKTVINWYKEYLNVLIQFNKENPEIFKIIYSSKQDNLESSPYLQFQATENNEFKLMSSYPQLAKKINTVSQGGSGKWLQDGWQITTLLCNMKRMFDKESIDKAK